MKPIKEKGLEELLNFRNRLSKSHGMNRIGKEDFERIYDKASGLIEEVKELDEKEGGKLYE